MTATNRSMYELTVPLQENKKMSEPMRKAIEEVKRLKQERETYRVDLQALAEAKAYILVEQDKLENMRWEHEILEQRFQRLAAERDALFDKFQMGME
jgi:cytochrome c-type biogenesis protein CcmH/NrfG